MVSDQVADTRSCEQCGISFLPRREHARFCSPSCRADWNRDHAGDLKAGASALRWSITAMNDIMKRLSRTSASDLRAFVLVSEAVWWVTIVDATLVRHHVDTYDRVIAGQPPSDRQRVEGILAGLRFVRNRIGEEADLAEFIQSGNGGTATGQGHIGDWAWRPVPEPALASLSPRGRSWEMSRYRAYQAELAGHTVDETFGRAAAFLKRAAADAPALTDPGAPATR
jgi:hypothetical protein